MRTFLNLVVLACVTQLITHTVGFGLTIDEDELNSVEIVKELNEAELSPEQTYNLLTSRETPDKIFKNYVAEDFERFVEFDESDCSRGQMVKRNNFIKELGKDADGSLAYQNLIRFCISFYEDMVRICEILKQSPNQ